MKNRVLVIRHPDYANEITTEGDVEVFDYDLGSSFDSEPDDAETAWDWMGESGPTELDDVPTDSPIYKRVMELYWETVGGFEVCAEVLSAYERRRGSEEQA